MVHREFDVVVYGASGFTGQLVAEYLVKNYSPNEFHWALAGRSEAKLAKVKENLGELEHVGLIVADSADSASLRAMAKRARVILTTVGPYVSYGAELVRVCAEEGTHYVDPTGEPPFVRQMADAHDATAKQTGARIVHCCGFDSVPSDLGTLLIADHLGSGDELDRVDAYFGPMRGGASGGTLASMFGLFENFSIGTLLKSMSANARGSIGGRTEKDEGARRPRSVVSQAGWFVWERR